MNKTLPKITFYTYKNLYLIIENREYVNKFQINLIFEILYEKG